MQPRAGAHLQLAIAADDEINRLKPKVAPQPIALRAPHGAARDERSGRGVDLDSGLVEVGQRAGREARESAGSTVERGCSPLTGRGSKTTATQ